MLVTEEQRHFKIQIYHQLIGSHSFEFTDKNHMSQLRLHITQNSPLYLYENFHFQLEGNRLFEYNQLSQIFKGDARLKVVFDPYDSYNSRYHQMRVKQILQNPMQWAVVNSRDIGLKLPEDQNEINYVSPQLDHMFQNPINSIFLVNGEKKEKQSQFGNILNVSGFNPPPYFRKLQGDFYYILIRSLEEVDFHITANSQGFFVNQSSQGCFNPNPHPKYSLCISLLQLIIQLSPKFKIKFQEIQKASKVTEFQKILHNFKPILQNWQWLKESNGWKKANTWKNDGYFEMQKHDFSVVKDWVQIFQFQRTCPGDSLYQKLGKQKIKYKLYQQFIDCAKEGVAKIFKGSLQPINTSLRFDHQVFYYSYLLFYFASNQSSQNHPSFTQVNRQLINISCIEPLDTDGVCLSHMVIIHYRGHKIVVRTIPSALINGHSSFESVKELFYKNNNLQTDQILSAVVKKICRQLGVESDNCISNEGKWQSVVNHPDIKGCVTKDKKRFIFDLIGFSPKDMNFNQQQDGECLLRPELMKMYNIRQKCQTLYNTLVGTKHKLSNNQKIRNQQKKLHSIAKYAKQIMIPSFIDSFDGEMRKYLSDSRGIISNLHKHGLSSKYLSMVYNKAVQKKSKHVTIMIERVILIKSLKHLFKLALRETSVYLHKSLLKHLLNCVFVQNSSGEGYAKDSKNDEDQDSNVKKNKKKKIKQTQSFMEINFIKPADKYLNIKHDEVWEQINNIAKHKFNHKLSQINILFGLQFSKTAILRDLCLCLGLQLQKKDYFCDYSIVFTQDHIINMIPRVKLIIQQPRQLSQLIEDGDKLAAKYQIQQAFQAYNKALQYIFSSFGGVHQKLGLINKKIANIYFKIGDPDTAVIFALNSCEIYELLVGPQHVETIEAYMMVGIYNFARKKFSSAQYFMLKAIFLSKFTYSESYPQLLGMYLNLSTIYEMQRKFTDAIMSIFYALNISIKVYGQNHLHTAIIYAALASLHYQIPDIQQAIQFQQKSIQILMQILPADDERIIQAKNICEGYRNVQMSKKIRQVHQKQQKNLLAMQSNGKINFKMPFYDFREKPAQLFWKKGRRMKYFL